MDLGPNEHPEVEWLYERTSVGFFHHFVQSCSRRSNGSAGGPSSESLLGVWLGGAPRHGGLAIGRREEGQNVLKGPTYLLPKPMGVLGERERHMRRDREKET
ncbi:unnamed protein product [Gadus morhua 'NCC']